LDLILNPTLKGEYNMAAANRLTVGTDLTPTSDITLAAVTPLVLKGNSVNANYPNTHILVQAKDDTGKYWTVALINTKNPVYIAQPGVYRLARKAVYTEAGGVFTP
jgi:hypothetical protein